MKPVDLDRFWADDELAHKDNCFSPDAPQVALGIRMSDECVFAELNEPGEPWGYTEINRRMELNRRYNDLAEKIVGRRLLSETFTPREECYPGYGDIAKLFGGTYVHDGSTTWLKHSCSTPEELEAVLDQVDKTDLENFILPENWYAEKKRIEDNYGRRAPLWRWMRGPVTFATSLFGAENLIYLYYDEPELYTRFSDTILRVMLEYIRISTREAGYTLETAPHYFTFCDDDCNLLTPEMYEAFGYPVLKKVFETCCPNPEDNRFQHSDSPMAHLLPILGRLNLNGCNFGPTVPVEEIRRYMPNTRIDGQLAPFTFMRNNEDDIIAEVKRDCDAIRSTGTKGLNLSTAGSINNGSLLTSMRAVMFAIQQYGQY